MQNPAKTKPVIIDFSTASSVGINACGDRLCGGNSPLRTGLRAPGRGSRKPGVEIFFYERWNGRV